MNIFQEGGNGTEAGAFAGNLLIIDIGNRPVLLAQKKSRCLKPGFSVRNGKGIASLLCLLLCCLLLGFQLCALLLGQFSGSCSRCRFTGRSLGTLGHGGIAARCCSTVSGRSSRAGSLLYDAGRRDTGTSGRGLIVLSLTGMDDAAAFLGVVRSRCLRSGRCCTGSLKKNGRGTICSACCKRTGDCVKHHGSGKEHDHACFCTSMHKINPPVIILLLIYHNTAKNTI